MAFSYQLGQAVMRLSQTEPQITGKIPLGKVAAGGTDMLQQPEPDVIFNKFPVHGLNS